MLAELPTHAPRSDDAISLSDGEPSSINNDDGVAMYE